MIDLESIPTSWARLTIADAVCSIPTTGKKIPQKEYLEQGKHAIVDQGQELIGGFTNDENAVIACHPPVIVFGDHTKVVKLIKSRFAPGADGVKVLKPLNFYDIKAFKFFLDFLVSDLVDKGYARHYQHLAIRELPLPPLAEQERIVAKIEELFSELDKGIENLKLARSQLAMYRQALLKHAFEGKLTADWREAHPNQFKSGVQLLADVRAERDATPSKQFVAWQSLAEDYVTELPGLPDGWTWLPFGNLCASIRNGISTKPAGETGEKILRISSVRPMKIDLTDCRYIETNGNEYDGYLLEENDLLFTRYNGSRKFVGVCGRFNGTRRRLFPDKLIRAKVGVRAALPKFLEACFGCGATRAFIESKIRTTAGQAGISGADIRAIPVPICSIDEQQEIIEILDASLPQIYRLESEIDANLQKSEALRQSILKKAFAGELVPQDPNDEPAAALLARIRAERASIKASSDAAPKTRTRKPKAAKA